ncbi:MAG: hypothetical protein IT376_22735, partial [Polyangiaceae bacterium]|nr:hypothetical protein [Polyangiaceae bacterium]
MSTERALRALARQVGGLSDRLGGALEDLAIETVPALLAAAWGLSDIERRRDLLQVDGVVGELDLVLRAKLPSGAPLAVLGEVSARLTRNEVDELLRSAR